MTQPVVLPLWLLLLILGFAAVTAASHLLFPSVRWFFRRRAERVVALVNQRLQRPIEPFKLARRHDMIQRLSYDAQVMAAVEEHAREEGIPENVAFEKAQRYAREIVPSFSASVYFGIAIRLARWLSTRLFRVRLGAYDDALEEIDPNATVIFVINHRSNMDYVLVTWLAAQRSALSYAVGEWARVWPLSFLIRSMGAYFIRRKSRNPLYRRVLARYVQLATAAGVTQAVFPEGSLSLDGKVAAPKLGLLSYVIAGSDPDARDVVFVPVGLNYDRVIEDRILTEAAASGDRRFRASIPTGLRFAARWAWRRMRGKARRFGFAAVSFGSPLSLKGVLDEHTGDPTRFVAAELFRRIRSVVPVLPVPLVASALLQQSGPISKTALTARVDELLGRLRTAGAHMQLPGKDASAAVDAGLKVLTLRKIVSESGAGLLTVVPDEAPLLDFYAASISHHLS
ncbi:MAG: glycerol-3-phosphate acyltransferase [Rhodobacteraceae bacterium]|nr:glycerol-3-phosphate acyltransferase [Paracoccaceae bacterium]